MHFRTGNVPGKDRVKRTLLPAIRKKPFGAVVAIFFHRMAHASTLTTTPAGISKLA
jgi:hypothetical protein